MTQRWAWLTGHGTVKGPYRLRDCDTTSVDNFPSMMRQRLVVRLCFWSREVPKDILLGNCTSEIIKQYSSFGYRKVSLLSEGDIAKG